jgi:hypothetical protein
VRTRGHDALRSRADKSPLTKHPVRRAQLVAPFGVGALAVFPDGVSLTIAGLDHWFPAGAGSGILDAEKFKVEEWRLQRRLGMTHFRLPPDYKAPWKFGGAEVNVGLTIPGIRFPLAHSCARCSRLDFRQPTERGRLHCDYCEREHKRSTIYQVQFVAMCEDGHMQDFPWREWAHRDIAPTCKDSMKIFASGGSSLVGVFVKCDCGLKRNLRGITEATRDGLSTVLTEQLAKGKRYLCRGLRPWLGDFDAKNCGKPLRGALRSSANSYFADTRTAVYIPRRVHGVDPALLEVLQRPPAAAFLSIAKDLETKVPPATLRARFPGLLDKFPDNATIERALAVAEAKPLDETEKKNQQPETDEEFRAFEWSELRSARSESQLKVREVSLPDYEPWIGAHFERLLLLDKLRHTRVFVGFSRIVPRTSSQPDRSQLWRDQKKGDQSWLPANVVFGEGIMLELNRQRLAKWETEIVNQRRAGLLDKNYAIASERRKSPPRTISPRLVLIHTLSHLLINQMSYESGYSAASLAERLYVAPHDSGDMAGVLIFTASGDSEGTMGGLVRLGKAGRLEPVIRRALERAGWCSSDPICMELGDSSGQGPDSCNLAACHNCTLASETSCEEFNRFLDRALVVGLPGDPQVGYFSEFAT